MQPSPVRKLPFTKDQNPLETARTVNMLVDGHFAMLRLYKWTSAPTGNDVYDGAMAYADGSGWDPGEGEGLYMYYNAAWNRIWGEHPCGSCYGDDILWSQGSAAENQWYPISDTDMNDGQLNGFSHDGEGKLTATYAGIYIITYHISGEMSSANTHYEVRVRINETETGPMQHFESAKASDHFPVSGGGIFTIGAGETIEISVRTTDSTTPTLGIDHLQFECVHLSRS